LNFRRDWNYQHCKKRRWEEPTEEVCGWSPRETKKESEMSEKFTWLEREVLDVPKEREKGQIAKAG